MHTLVKLIKVKYFFVRCLIKMIKWKSAMCVAKNKPQSERQGCSLGTGGRSPLGCAYQSVESCGL